MRTVELDAAAWAHLDRTLRPLGVDTAPWRLRWPGLPVAQREAFVELASCLVALAGAADAAPKADLAAWPEDGRHVPPERPSPARRRGRGAAHALEHGVEAMVAMTRMLGPMDEARRLVHV